MPFCARRCSYCDFSIAVRRIVPATEYVEALRRELALRFPRDGPWTVDTLYFGGGTPSRLGAAGVSAIMRLLRDRLTLADGAEVTLEANPEDITDETVRAWHDVGVNRLSIGAQSFDDRVLAWMHRTHDAAAIGRAVDVARRGGIDNLSIDLIFALPESVKRSWANDVERALALDPPHLSLYGLTIEPHTPLGRWQSRGQVTESPEERYELEFTEAHHALTSGGLEHYEVSNFGRPGFHARHNSAYWAAVPYAGLGPSAHEFNGTGRRWNTSAYVDWLRRLGSGHDPVAGSEELTRGNMTAEAVYLGLRTTKGLRLSGPEVARVQPWVEAGWAVLDASGHMVLTPLGWLRLDAIAADLTLIRSRY